jgi:hypothetical protein
LREHAQRESLDVFDRSGYLSPIQRDWFEHKTSGRPIDQLSVGRRERMSHSEEDPFFVRVIDLKQGGPRSLPPSAAMFDERWLRQPNVELLQLPPQ